MPPWLRKVEPQVESPTGAEAGPSGGAMAGRSLVSFTLPEAARLSGVPEATVRYWARSRFLEPTVPAIEKYQRPRYLFRDLVALRAAKQLRAAGVSLQSLRRVVDWVRSHYAVANPLAERALVAENGDVLLETDAGAVSAGKAPGQRVLRELNLPGIVAELWRDAKQLRAEQVESKRRVTA